MIPIEKKKGSIWNQVGTLKSIYLHMLIYSLFKVNFYLCQDLLFMTTGFPLATVDGGQGGYWRGYYQDQVKPPSVWHWRLG